MEERLKFLSAGTKPRKNKDAMKEILEELKEEGLYFADTKVKANREQDDDDG